MKPCPICQKPASPAHKPFCSARCADVDLHHWLSENYRVPVREEEAEEDLAAVTPTAPPEPEKPH
jgi:endogenous inhibitor of DNA gyrase (YacG/DUF329 family)